MNEFLQCTELSENVAGNITVISLLPATCTSLDPLCSIALLALGKILLALIVFLLLNCIKGIILYGDTLQH